VKLARHFIWLLAILPIWPTRAQDLRVRLYALHPPAEITVKALSDSLQWRTCAGCQKNSATRLQLQAVGSELRVRDAGVSREVFLSGAFRIEASGLPPISANFPVQIQASDAHLLLTAALPVEDYVAAVLAGESGDFRNDESLKAMAVVIRTYATRFRGQHSDEGFDFCDTTHCQVPSWNNVSSRISAAADATRSEILTFRGAAVSAFYHQNCGGTVAASHEAWPSVTEPCLRTHSDPYCVTASPLKWETSISVADLDAALPAPMLHARSLESEHRLAEVIGQMVRAA
jgi:stage II sporulation protein D (peptidoglycan lytic transglycosylase)